MKGDNVRYEKVEGGAAMLRMIAEDALSLEGSLRGWRQEMCAYAARAAGCEGHLPSVDEGRVALLEVRRIAECALSLAMSATSAMTAIHTVEEVRDRLERGGDK